ncbi:F-box domain containing protein [Trema orientale]|uniref:F-box domain containing protein n=1 Tax=Trema orientale TaxID=63057 RepID=A0A2P5CCH3_TREOI|nr:F-box domain containing protein [Trema orientale]
MRREVSYKRFLNAKRSLFKALRSQLSSLEENPACPKPNPNPNPGSAETTRMASLPWDTIVNILSRLPVEDLLRYRCVSKRWCSLIDGPRFIKMHLDHSMETSSHLTLIRAGRQLHSVDLDTLNKVVRLNPPNRRGSRDGDFGWL